MFFFQDMDIIGDQANSPGQSANSGLSLWGRPIQVAGYTVVHATFVYFILKACSLAMQNKSAVNVTIRRKNNHGRMRVRVLQPQPAVAPYRAPAYYYSRLYEGGRFCSERRSGCLVRRDL